jgi:hypothetical protein
LLPAVIERSGYFDRLDAAFSMLASNPPGQAGPPIAASPDPPQPAPGDVDWFDRTTVSGAVEAWDDLPAALDAPHAAADLPLAYEAAQTESSIHAPEPLLPDVPPKIEAVAGSAPAAAPDDRLAPIEAPQPIEPEAIPVASVVLQAAESPAPNPVALPALADAFAALLAAEQREPLSARSGLWPTTLAPSAEAREELVEEVVRRVLDRLSGTVREAVANIASDVAERVIREEIERIKTSLK